MSSGRRWRFLLPTAWVLGGCGPQPAPPCGAFDETFAYVDADGDGFGSTEPVGWVCGIDAGQATSSSDCDDASEAVHPGASEDCDGVDDDCNGRIDEGSAFVPWYPDEDGDGYGVTALAVTACASPAPGFGRTGGDCDDVRPDVNPGAIEICNEAVDDDCDGFADDDDAGVDPSTRDRWYFDGDGDGWGDDELFLDLCLEPTIETATERGGDCDDGRAAVNPGRTEVCNGDRDDDCDGVADDDDPSVDPGTQTTFFADRDGDGFGDPGAFAPACEATPGIGVLDNRDCDDGDPDANLEQDWFVDTDGDGAGDGSAVLRQCLNPLGGLVPERGGVDCEPLDPAVFPGQTDVCGDGIDQDCSGADRACATWMYTVNEGTDTLERVDVDTLSWESIGPLNVAFDFGDLAYDEATQTLYLIDGRGAQGLYTVDLLTGAASLVGLHGVTDLFALAVDSTTGTLYAASFSGSVVAGRGLYELDPRTGAATRIGDPGIGLDSMTYDASRDQLVGVEAGPGAFYSLDRTTGAATGLGGSIFVDNGGVAWDPLDDDYWYIDWGGRLYRYDPTNLAVQTVVQSGLGSHAGLVYVADPPN